MEILEIIKNDNLIEFEEFFKHINDIDFIIEINEIKNNNFLIKKLPIICLCSYFDSLNCFMFLQNRDADLSIKDIKGRDVSHYACAGGSTSICDLLDSIGFDFNLIDFDGCSCLHYAFMSGCLSLCQQLWMRGMNLFLQDKNRFQPIHYSCMNNNNLEIIDFFSKNGCNLNENAFEWTPFSISIKYNSSKILNFLLENNIKINDIEGFYPLIYASKEGFEEIIKILSKSKQININYRDKFGWTSLLFAIDKGYFNICKILIQNGADINLSSNYGFSPLHAALNRGYEEISNYLENLGAISNSKINFPKTSENFLK